MRNLFSKEIKEKHIIYKIFGAKFSAKNPTYISKLKEETEQAIKTQNSYDLTPLNNTKKLALFLISAESKINGGIMSIFSLCETTRELLSDGISLISTYPNSKYTYSENNFFLNNEKIYRFSQIIENGKNLDELIIHIPEYYAKKFYKDLTKKEKQFLKSIKNLQINILNQNIELMPLPKKLQNLFKLTNNVTQTLAHNRYATQEVCNKWNIPTHLFSVFIDMSKYKAYPFEEKEKIIVLSPDKHQRKEEIVNKLQKEFEDWQFITVANLTFSQYMDLISRAFFTITFGEGMDGYFLQPTDVESVGIAVYNDEFFPDITWKDLFNVYESYDSMSEKIVEDIKSMLNDKNLYTKTINEVREKTRKIYVTSAFKDNLKRFYNQKYDFYPSKNK